AQPSSSYSSSSRYLLSFFFSLSLPLRDLHSFPTRRSSDLRPPAGRHREPVLRARSPRRRHLHPVVLDHQPAGHSAGRLVHLHHRSEEHTSELQSRGHLVCRLLLEKKKKTQKQSKNNHLSHN